MSERRIAYHIDHKDARSEAITYLLIGLGVTSRPFNLNTMVSTLLEAEPGCLLIDADTPDIDCNALSILASRRPVDLPVIVMSATINLEGALVAMRCGARDYIAKPLRRETLAVSMALIFERLRDAQTAYDLRQGAQVRIDGLSGRERAVLFGLIAGRSNKLQAADLGLSIRTVEMHRSRLMAKLRVQNLAETIRLALSAGYNVENGGKPRYPFREFNDAG